MPRRIDANLLFRLLVLVMVLGALRLWHDGVHLQSNLLDLLPKDQHQGAAQLAGERLSEAAGNDFVFLIGGSEAGAATEIARWLGTRIAANREFELLSPEQQIDAYMAHQALLKRHRFHLLTEQQAAQLRSAADGELLQQAIAETFSLTAAGSIASPVEDPLGLFSRYLESGLASPANVRTRQGLVHLTAGDRVFALVHGRVVSGAFNLDAQSAMAALERELGDRVQQEGAVTVLRSGAIFHASAASEKAKAEVTVIALGSALGIIILFLVTFRSLRPLLLSLSSIAFGCLAALVLCANLFDSVHLLTLVFGASLIGVAVDYALHYLVREHDGRPGLPGLGLALLTSTLGYGSLLQARLPGLAEMAIFSIAGLLASGLFVVVVFPRFSRTAARKRPSAMLALSNLPRHLGRRPVFWIAFILGTAGLLITGTTRLDNDLRIFHTPEQVLLDEQAAIEEMLPGRAPNQFFVIESSSPELLLQQAEHFKPALEQLVSGGAIGAYALISDFLPSPQRQLRNHQLLRETVYRPGGDADQYFTRLGFSATAREQFHSALATAQPMTVADWSKTAPREQALLWLGEWQGRFFSIVQLSGVRDLEALRRAAADIEEIEFIDTVALLSNTLETRSRAAARVLVLAYCAIAALLLIRYRQWSALRLLLVPLGASLMTIAILGALGIPLTLFHLFALYLILGLGMDYGIFLRESGPQVQSCLLAILLSVLTSSLSFGLLALSSTPMIAAFGLTVMLGGLGNWLLAPLAITQTGKHRTNLE